MLTVRVIPVVLHDGVTCLKPVRFGRPARPCGALLNAVNVYEARQADELVIIDLAARARRIGPDLALLSAVSERCFMPLAWGGGVRSEADVDALLRAGADKIVLGAGFFGAELDSNRLRPLAKRWGRQAVVAAVDALAQPCGGWRVYDCHASRALDRDAVDWASEVAAAGAGEILLTAVDREGTRQGYDLALIRAVRDSVGVPIIAHGGAGLPEHCVEAIKAGASAVAAGSMFHYTQHRPADVRAALATVGFPTREPWRKAS